MGKINGCLRGLFIFFNTLFAIDGCLMYYGVMQNSDSIDQLSAFGAPVWIWVFVIGIFSISCMGIYAGVTEKEILLKRFAGFMGVGMIIMLIFGILLVVTKNKALSTESIKDNEKLRKLLDGFQRSGLLDIALGMCFGYAVIALLGLLVSLLMIYQVRRHDGLGGTSIALRRY